MNPNPTSDPTQTTPSSGSSTSPHGGAAADPLAGYGAGDEGGAGDPGAAPGASAEPQYLTIDLEQAKQISATLAHTARVQIGGMDPERSQREQPFGGLFGGLLDAFNGDGQCPLPIKQEGESFVDSVRSRGLVNAVILAAWQGLNLIQSMRGRGSASAGSAERESRATGGNRYECPECGRASVKIIGDPDETGRYPARCLSDDCQATTTIQAGDSK